VLAFCIFHVPTYVGQIVPGTIDRSGGFVRGLVSGGSGAVTSTVDPLEPLFSVIGLIVDNDAPERAFFANGGNKISLTGTGDNTLLALGRAGSSTYGQIDVLEAQTYPFAFSPAQIAASYAAMKLAYVGRIK
jgi:hypothetical protein